LLYGLVAAIVIILAVVGFFMWRRKVASDYDSKMAVTKKT
jgi:hypothetical protein